MTTNERCIEDIISTFELVDVIMTSGFFEADREPLDDEVYKPQVYNSVSEIKISSEADETGLYRGTIKYECGIRLIDPDKVDGDGDPYTYFEITGTFEARYYISEPADPSINEVRAYGEVFTGRDVWPYWREYVKSCCNRLGIQGLNVGPFPDFDESERH